MASFKYGNALTDDLWDAWEQASGKPVSKIMSRWTRQCGFPLLELEEVTPDASGMVRLKMSQGWYLADGSVVETSEEKLWPIPVFSPLLK